MYKQSLPKLVTIAILLCLLGVCERCQPKEQIVVVVHVQGLIPAIQQLHAHATLNGKPAMKDQEITASQGLDRFVVLLPKNELSLGALELTATALGGDLCKMAAGQTKVALAAGQTYAEVELNLVQLPSTMCTLTVINHTDANLAVSPAGLSCGTTCSYDFQKGLPIQLTASRAVAKSYGTRWDAPCAQPNSDVCTIIPTAPMTITATSLPRLCSPTNWCWYNPLPQGIGMFSVWGSSARDFWAVGNMGTAMHWDGARWTLVESGTTATLYRVFGFSAADVWAVGANGLAIHWDGASWTRIATQTGGDLNGLWGSAANDVWAAGDSLQHLTGTAWKTVSSVPALTKIYALWGSAASDVWAVGSGAAIGHWDGKAWTSVPSPAPTVTLMGVWGASSTDVWAVGNKGIVLHWNGSVWSIVPSGTTNDLLSIRGVSTNDVTSVGKDGLVLRWNGTTWYSIPTNTFSSQLADLWPLSASEAWAVGSGGTVLRWDGMKWTPESSGTGLTRILTEVWGSSASDVWTVGAGGVILHWDGANWRPSPSGTTSFLNSVAGSAANDVWAVGSAGTVRHWNGTAWVEVVSPMSINDLNSVWAHEGGVCIVGDLGTILQGSDVGLTATKIVPSNKLNAVWGSSLNNIWAVGDAGTILHWDGITWTPQVPAITTDSLHGIWGSGPSDIWATGSTGFSSTIYHYDGFRWSVASNLPRDTVDRVWGSGPGDLWLWKYMSPLVWHGDGTNWSLVDQGTVSFGVGMWGSSPSDIWTVGYSGNILRFQP